MVFSGRLSEVLGREFFDLSKDGQTNHGTSQRGPKVFALKSAKAGERGAKQGLQKEAQLSAMFLNG
jgi:hypothetical protein